MSDHKNARMVDIISDDEGPFAPERTGRVPYIALAKLCFSGKYHQSEIIKTLRWKGGLTAYLKTNKAYEVEEMIKSGKAFEKLGHWVREQNASPEVGAERLRTLAEKTLN